MFSTLLLAMAPAIAANGAPARPIQEFRQGPMPAENIWLRPAHPGGPDYHMFPDIALSGLRIDGDTLYVQVKNEGHSATPGAVMVAARAEENGGRTGLVQQQTGKLQPGETRWVQLRGFSVKTASTSSAVFALESASAVSAVARMLPSSAPTLDRSGQTLDASAEEADESNNVLSLAGSAIPHGKPQ